MGEWYETTWGEVITLQRGYDITKNEQALDGDVPVVSSGGISSFHDQSMSEGPGVVMGQKGTLGRVYYVAGRFWPHDTTLWVKDYRGSHPRFVYYALKAINPDHLNVGSASPTLNRNHVHPLPVRWPSDLGEQRSIAEVLGALDDKIAANDRTVRTALDLADANFQRAVSGDVSVEQRFVDVASIGGGGTPKTAVPEYWDGDVAWTTPTDVTRLSAPYLRNTGRTITPEGLAACSSALYPKGSILMTSRATIGAFAVAQRATAVNQGFIVVNAHDPAHQWWLFHEMKDRVPEFLNHANGATFMELPRGKFKELAARLPDPATLDRFVSTVAPLHDFAAHLSAESERLATTRDELLPVLMSGKLRVKDAESDLLADTASALPMTR